MELKATRVEIDEHVATVWLHRPHRHNAWTGRMHAEYRWILADLEQRPDVRAVVVTGTPPAFCVGGDSDALAGHAERGAYDDGLREEPARPGGDAVRPEHDADAPTVPLSALTSPPKIDTFRSRALARTEARPPLVDVLTAVPRPRSEPPPVLVT